MRSVLFWLKALTGCLLLSAGFVAPPATVGSNDQPEQPTARGVFVEEVRNTQPAFQVRVSVDHADRTYRGGEEIKVTVQSGVEGYLYLFYLDAQKKPWVLFPNHVHGTNRIVAGKPVTVPAADAKFRLRVGAPFGPEVLKAVVSRQPLNIAGMEVARLAQKEVTEIQLEQMRSLYAALKDSPTQWAEHLVEITTVAPGTTPPVPPKEKRVGLFVGIGKYQAAADLVPPFPVCPVDARVIADVMKARCALDETIVLEDDNATLKNLETNISRTMPSKTKPGDTVVIFWSGHGARLERRATGKVEHALVTHDTLSEDTFLWENVLARWLQALDGRRIIFIADCCHASGLHDRGKTIRDPDRPDGGQDDAFLNGLMTKAKGFDQKDLALLAGCKAKETSKVRRERDLSVLTHFLLEQLRNGDGPLTLKQIYEGLKEPVAKYVASNFPTDPLQTPVLIDDLTPPFVLRAARAGAPR